MAGAGHGLRHHHNNDAASAAGLPLVAADPLLLCPAPSVKGEGQIQFVMQPEFQALAEEAKSLWWRVPLAVSIVTSIPLLFYYAIVEPEERETEPPQSRAPAARPVTLSIFRCSGPFIAGRFAWIYFANLSLGAAYQLSQIEAILWCLYVFCGIPIWITCEYEHREAMRHLRSGGGSNLP